jgi:hypothetical protein
MNQLMRQEEELIHIGKCQLINMEEVMEIENQHLATFAK